MVNVHALNTPLTTAGKPVTVALVPPPLTAYVMVLIAVFTQRVWLFVFAGEVRLIVAFGDTVMVPEAVVWLQVPVVVTV